MTSNLAGIARQNSENYVNLNAETQNNPTCYRQLAVGEQPGPGGVVNQAVE